MTQPATSNLSDASPLDLHEARLAFVECVKAGMGYAEAADAAGVHRATAWRWRQNPEFAKLVELARDINVEMLVEEAKRRALHSSDRLLEFMLCNLAPDRFQRAQRVELSGSLDINAMTEDEIRAELAALTGAVAPSDDGSDLI